MSKNIDFIVSQVQNKFKNETIYFSVGIYSCQESFNVINDDSFFSYLLMVYIVQSSANLKYDLDNESDLIDYTNWFFQKRGKQGNGRSKCERFIVKYLKKYHKNKTTKDESFINEAKLLIEVSMNKPSLYVKRCYDYKTDVSIKEIWLEIKEIDNYQVFTNYIPNMKGIIKFPCFEDFAFDYICTLRKTYWYYNNEKIFKKINELECLYKIEKAWVKGQKHSHSVQCGVYMDVIANILNEYVIFGCEFCGSYMCEKCQDEKETFYTTIEEEDWRGDTFISKICYYDGAYDHYCLKKGKINFT